MRVGSLCTGYGGIELGLTLAGVEVDLRWIAETDPTLAPLWGDAPNLGDITAVEWGAVERVDLLTAGFPCQPVSAAGRQRGDRDSRWLWPHVRDAIAGLRPALVLIENVRNLVSMRGGVLWRGILDDLTTLGYDVRWAIIGACHVGAAHHRHRVFALATAGRPDAGGASVERVEVAPCGARALLPTPTAREGDKHGRGEGSEYYWRKRREVGRTSGMPLGAAVTLLPTPQSRDGQGRGTPSEETAVARWASGRRNIDDAMALLPTPRASDGANGGPNQRGARGDLALPSVVQSERWGRFAAAVARHEAIYGAAPLHVEPNRNGAPRLAPAFAEWLMCIPRGHVTAGLARRDALRVIGNGVCPPAAAVAWRMLREGSDMTTAITATWDQVHAGDTVRGADQRVWTVVGRERGPAWTRSGQHDRYEVERDGQTITFVRPIADPAPLVTRADHSGEAAAIQALIDSGLTGAVVSEGTMTAEVEAPCAHPDVKLSKLSNGQTLCTGCGKYVASPCEHPTDALTRIKSGRIKCTACKGYPSSRKYSHVAAYDAATTVDVPGASRAVEGLPAPDGGTGGGAMITGSSPPANPTPPIPLDSVPPPTRDNPADPFFGARIEGGPVDPFAAPAVLMRAGSKRLEPPRGKYGWYELPDPDTGETDLWPRVSTIKGTLADTYGLTKWQLRKLAKGMALRPDLIASAGALDIDADKSKIDQIVETALKVAGTDAAANFGTAIHAFADRYDDGESIVGMGVPAQLVPDVEAYGRTLREHGLTVLTEYSERVVVHKDGTRRYAGQIDRIVMDRAGRLYILDLKTGQDLSYSWFEFCQQLALYAQATHMCSPDYRSYEPMPSVDVDKALILHIPHGSGTGAIHGLPINKGWAAAQTAMVARELRSQAKDWNWLVRPQSPIDVVMLHIGRATTLDQLQGVAANAHGRGLWTAEVERYALTRHDHIRAVSAATPAELAALWEELHPLGRWTDDLDAAARQHAAELAQATH